MQKVDLDINVDMHGCVKFVLREGGFITDKEVDFNILDGKTVTIQLVSSRHMILEIHDMVETWQPNEVTNKS